MEYFIARNGQQIGTYPKEEALARFERGEILPTDLVWCEGMSDWLPAAQVLGTTPPPAPEPSVQPAPVPPPPAPLPTQPAPPPSQPKPANYLVWSILATVLCCLPLGIVAIIYAAQVDSKYAKGDYAGALAASKNAKVWTIVSAVVGFVVSLGFAILSIVGAAAGEYGGY